jgi:hypothetical protein
MPFYNLHKFLFFSRPDKDNRGTTIELRANPTLFKVSSQSSKGRLLPLADRLLANAQMLRDLGFRLSVPENLFNQPPIGGG